MKGEKICNQKVASKNSAECQMYCSNNNKSNCQQAGKVRGGRQLRRRLRPGSAWLASVATTSCTCFQLNNVAFIFTGCATTTTSKRTTAKGWAVYQSQAAKIPITSLAYALSPSHPPTPVRLASSFIIATASTNYPEQEQQWQTALSALFAPFLHFVGYVWVRA